MTDINSSYPIRVTNRNVSMLGLMALTRNGLQSFDLPHFSGNSKVAQYPLKRSENRTSKATLGGKENVAKKHNMRKTSDDLAKRTGAGGADLVVPHPVQIS